MKYLTLLALVSMMSLANAEQPKLGEDQATVTKDVTGTECMAPACIQQRKDKAEADRKAAGLKNSKKSATKK